MRLRVRGTAQGRWTGRGFGFESNEDQILVFQCHTPTSQAIPSLAEKMYQQFKTKKDSMNKSTKEDIMTQCVGLAAWPRLTAFACHAGAVICAEVAVGVLAWEEGESGTVRVRGSAFVDLPHTAVTLPCLATGMVMLVRSCLRTCSCSKALRSMWSTTGWAAWSRGR